MPRAGILLLAALLFAALLSLIFWPDPADEAASSPVPSQLAATVDGLAQAASSPPSPVIGNNDERIETIDTTTTADLTPYDLGDEGFLVTVVNKENQAKVSHADVYFLSSDMDAIDVYNKFSGRDWAARITPLREHGIRYRTNNKGEVRLPRLGKYQFVFAEQGKLYSSPQICSSKKGELKFELIPNRKFKVKVISANGLACADIPIELLRGDATLKTRQMLVYSNESGEAVLEGLNKHLEEVRNSGNLYVGFGFPMHLRKQNESTQVILTPERLMEGEVTLIKPGTCSIDVRVVEASGELCTEQGWIGIENKVPPQLYLETRSSKNVDQGEAHFPDIGLDTELKVSFNPGSSRNDDLVEFLSPSTPGASMTVEIRRAPRASIVGTIVEDDGAPMAEQRIRTREFLDNGDGNLSIGNRFTTDAEGRFRYELLREGEMGRLESRALALSIETEGQPPRQLRLDLPANPEPGQRDVGDLYLEALPLILSGTVLSPEGAPIAKSRVEFSYAYDRTSTDWLWTNSEVPTARTAQDGKFQIFGHAEQGLAFRVSASPGQASGHRFAYMEFNLGEKDLDIVLRKNSALMGTVRISDDMQFGDLSCRRVGGHSASNVRLRASDQKGIGLLRISEDNFEPFSLEIQTDFGETILEVPNLVLEEGKELSPPQLQGLDVRGRTQWLELSIQNKDGIPISAVIAVTQPNGSITGKRLPDGQLRTLIVNGLKKVEVDAPGFVSRTLHDVSASQAVTMETAVPITLQVDPQFLPDNNLELHIDQTPWPNLVAMTNVTDSLIPPSGKYSTFVNDLGRYKFELRITHHLHGSEKLPIQAIQVEEFNQHFSLEIDPNAYQEAMAKMQAKIKVKDRD
jgi:hypothetical protein